jgi:hypothetical protein
MSTLPPVLIMTALVRQPRDTEHVTCREQPSQIASVYTLTDVSLPILRSANLLSPSRPLLQRQAPLCFPRLSQKAELMRTFILSNSCLR